MSSILDALRKVEREKAEVTQAVDADFDEAAAERDLIGGTDGRGHMVLHLPPWVLMAFGGAFVLTVVVTAGVAWLYLRGPEATPPVAMVATAPAPVAVPAPKPEPPKPAVAATVPVVKEPEQEIVVAKAPTPKPVVELVTPEPPKPEPMRMEEQVPEPAPPVAEETPVPEPQKGTKTIAKAVEEREAAQPQEEEKPAEEVKPKPEEPEADKPAEAKVEEPRPEEPKAEPAPEPVQVAKAEEMPAPLPEMKEPPVVLQPTIGEPLKSAPRPAEPIESAVPAETEKAGEGAVLPPSEEDRRLIKLNMPRPANKRNPYASAIINLQPVFLNEMIPGTTAKLISVEEKGVIILKQDTGTRHFIPF
ncbi:MAG: hypothetical protein RBU21_03330 [FCB group bacterium]|jgi:hypothetical protein|nr:hypothetical protein [FCB group bacterium]